MSLQRRIKATNRNRTSEGWTEAELELIEQQFSDGMSAQEVVAMVTDHGDRLTEATFRKYVQLGLLPRSRRVARKGKGRGSLGLYPPTTIRQLAHIRRLMRQGFSIEEIQTEFLFVRGDVEALGRQLTRIYSLFEDALVSRSGSDPLSDKALLSAREQGTALIETLESVERRLTLRARMARATV